VSGRQLDELFQIWLFTPSKPAGIETAAAARALGASALGTMPSRFPKR
jgi:hypothetical protein